MGSRYGGLKQIDPMGPNGETLLDYSLCHAIAAGFQKIVFVVREEFATDFHEKVGSKYQANAEISYIRQSLDDLPEGFSVPHRRKKPWGTAHAVWAARDEIEDPFVVVNADDYYGADAYERIFPFFNKCDPNNPCETAMVAYPVRKTLSAYGNVNRGICRVEGHRLITVEEHTELKESDGIIHGCNLGGELVVINSDALVSMNFWAFTPGLFPILQQHFVAFLQHHGRELDSEWYIPSVVDTLIRSRKARCKVFPTTGDWFGVTYPDDKAAVQAKLRGLDN